MVEISALSNLSLAQTLELHPWFAAARAEYVFRQGGETHNQDAIDQAERQAALFFQYRKDLRIILKRRISGQQICPVVEKNQAEAQESKTSYYSGVGDYFSREDFQALEKEGLAVETPCFGAVRQKSEEMGADLAPTQIQSLGTDDLCSETLAEVFANQQFYQRAIDIYEKLILLYPEKSAYFASLIEKVKKLKQ